MDKKLLDVKKDSKSSRPKFVRMGAKHVKRVSRSGYRKPKGVHNKVGNNIKGRRTTIATGYGYPKAVRGLNKNGLLPVVVSSEAELLSIDTKTQVAVIASSVGGRKKIALLEIAKEKLIAISGVEDVEKTVAELKETKAAYKKAQLEKSKKRTDKKDAAVKAKSGKNDEKKADVKKSEATESKDEVKDEKAQKKEQDKVLISKNA
jgi:large subunit ribosomal protein L32e